MTFTDHNGQVTGYRSFDIFGKPKGGDGLMLSPSGRLMHASSEVSTRRGFTDHEHLDEVELIHMNGRVYDYNLGRFMSVDPFIYDAENSQTINPYSYLMNNPLAGTDPSGYSPLCNDSNSMSCRPGAGDVKTVYDASSFGRSSSGSGNPSNFSGSLTAGVAGGKTLIMGNNGAVIGEKSPKQNTDKTGIGGPASIAKSLTFGGADNDTSSTTSETLQPNSSDKNVELNEMSKSRNGLGPDAMSLPLYGYNPVSGEKNALYIEYMKNITDDPNTFDWGAHGAVDRVAQIGVIQMRNGDYRAAHQYAVRKFLEDNGWKPGMNIRLLACLTGAMGENSFAQKLANILNVKVTAPINLLEVDSNGKMQAEFVSFRPLGNK